MVNNILNSRAYIKNIVGVSTRKQPTYNWSCVNGFSELIPQIFSDCSGELYFDIVNASRTENCNHLKFNDMWFGVKGIHGIKTSSTLYFPIQNSGFHDVVF